MNVIRMRISEKDFRQQVVDLAHLLGYMVYFTWGSFHSPKGFPDLVLVHPKYKRVIFAELKTETGKLTECQEQWLTALEACGQEVYVWRPRDLDGIVSLLRLDARRTKDGKLT
jgi:hypothetical protein